jgi:hypothetical protein
MYAVIRAAEAMEACLRRAEGRVKPPYDDDAQRNQDDAEIEAAAHRALDAARKGGCVLDAMECSYALLDVTLRKTHRHQQQQQREETTDDDPAGADSWTRLHALANKITAVFDSIHTAAAAADAKDDADKTAGSAPAPAASPQL